MIYWKLEPTKTLPSGEEYRDEVAKVGAFSLTIRYWRGVFQGSCSAGYIFSWTKPHATSDAAKAALLKNVRRLLRQMLQKVDNAARGAR